MAITQKEKTTLSVRTVEAKVLHDVRIDISTPEGHTIIADEPPARGGGNEGPSPLAYFTASLASCQGVQIVKVAEAMRFKHGAIAIKASTTTDRLASTKGNDRVMRFCAASLEIDIETDEAADRVERLKVLSVDRCPVGNLFTDAGYEPEVSWNVLPLKP